MKTAAAKNLQSVKNINDLQNTYLNNERTGLNKDASIQSQSDRQIILCSKLPIVGRSSKQGMESTIKGSNSIDRSAQT